MAKKLKCWNRTANQTRYVRYRSKDKEGVVEIFKQTPNQDFWEARRWAGNKRLDKPNKEFEKKSQAEKFAKSYMRKHDKC